MQTHPFLDGIDSVVRRSGVDADFRELALKDPLAALQQVSEIEIPTNTRVRFVEEIDELVIALPPLQESGELAEDKLGDIQGGQNHIYWTHINILTDRTASGHKGTREWCRKVERNNLPGWLRGFLDNVFG